MTRLLPALLWASLVTTVTSFHPSKPSWGRRFGVSASTRTRTSSLGATDGDDHFDMDELRQRIYEQNHKDERNMKLFLKQQPRTECVYILMFDVDTEDEGVHTIEIDSGQNIILAFESLEECAKFGKLLKAQEFQDPQPQKMNLQNLERYCDELDVMVQLVPSGMELIPPAQTVEEREPYGSLEDSVHILLFNPDTADEGVHTIEMESGQSVILAFQSLTDCSKFAELLKAQQFYDPKPQKMHLEKLNRYCEQLGVTVRVVPPGMELIPPTNSVENLEHNPSWSAEQNRLEELWLDPEAEKSDMIAGPGVMRSTKDVGSWD